MDAEEIDRLTRGVEPLDDFFPKRLSDVQPDLDPVYRLARDYLGRSRLPAFLGFFIHSRSLA